MTTYKDTEPDLEPDTSTGDRFDKYKRQCRERSETPMAWREWMFAGQPLYGWEDDE